MNHGLRDDFEQVTWDKAPDSKYLTLQMVDTHVIYDVSEMQAI